MISVYVILRTIYVYVNYALTAVIYSRLHLQVVLLYKVLNNPNYKILTPKEKNIFRISASKHGSMCVVIAITHILSESKTT